MSKYHRLILPDDEREKLDRLIGAAMLDSTVCRRLIGEQDTALFEEYELSLMSRELINTSQASSLTELADAIVAFETAVEFSGTVTLRPTTID